MTSIYLSEKTCKFCKNLLQILPNPNCRAFKKGIPIDVINGDIKHFKPLPKQGNDIVFEKIKS